MNITELDRADAKLLQIGLQALGLYMGTTRGRPGPKTLAAYKRYLSSVKTDGIGDIVATIAEAEVGVREVPIDSNRGERVEEYQKATWLDGTGWPWCAAFVCWCIREASKTETALFDLPLTAGAWDFVNWANDQGLQVFDPQEGKPLIRRGDIIVFRFSHIGIAVQDSIYDLIQTVEGNTDEQGSREGGGVYKKTRYRSSVRSVIRM